MNRDSTVPGAGARLTDDAPNDFDAWLKGAFGAKFLEDNEALEERNRERGSHPALFNRFDLEMAWNARARALLSAPVQEPECRCIGISSMQGCPVHDPRPVKALDAHRQQSAPTEPGKVAVLLDEEHIEALERALLARDTEEPPNAPGRRVRCISDEAWAWTRVRLRAILDRARGEVVDHE